MRVVLGFEGGTGGADMVDFHGWLLESREVTRAAEVGLRTGQATGAMSAGDAIVVSASAVSSLSAVVQAYAAWRSSRQHAPALVVTFEGGGSITVARGSAQEIASVVRAAATENESAQPAPVVPEGHS